MLALLTDISDVPVPGHLQFYFFTKDYVFWFKWARGAGPTLRHLFFIICKLICLLRNFKHFSLVTGARENLLCSSFIIPFAGSRTFQPSPTLKSTANSITPQDHQLVRSLSSGLIAATTALLFDADALGVTERCWLLEGSTTQQSAQNGAAIFRLFW